MHNMIRTHFAVIGLFLLIVATAAADRPNILLILSDDHAKKALSCYGNTDIQTPALDRIAKEGMRFNHALTPNSFCTPARAAVLTGKYSHKNGVTHLNQSFDGSQQTFPKLLQAAGYRPEEVTLAPILKAAGYRTAHYGKWHVGAVKEGSPLSPNNLGFDESLSHDNFFELNPELSRNGKPAQRIEGESSEILVREALDFAARSQSVGKPFFIVIWFGSPHSPYEALENDPAPYKHLGEELSHLRRAKQCSAVCHVRHHAHIAGHPGYQTRPFGTPTRRYQSQKTRRRWRDANAAHADRLLGLRQKARGKEQTMAGRQRAE